MIAMRIPPVSVMRSAKTITPRVAETTLAEYCRLAASRRAPAGALA